MKQQLLLLQDVDALGKKGEIVTAKLGYVRNYLIPKGYAIFATQNTLRKQERLRAERAEQAVQDRQFSDALAKQVEGLVLEIRVKVDPEGHMYGSVSSADLVRLFEERGIAVERKTILLVKPLKETGTHTIPLRFKEGVMASFQLQILPEGKENETTEKEPQ